MLTELRLFPRCRKVLNLTVLCKHYFAHFVYSPCEVGGEFSNKKFIIKHVETKRKSIDKPSLNIWELYDILVQVLLATSKTEISM